MNEAIETNEPQTSPPGREPFLTFIKDEPDSSGSESELEKVNKEIVHVKEENEDTVNNLQDFEFVNTDNIKIKDHIPPELLDPDPLNVGKQVKEELLLMEDISEQSRSAKGVDDSNATSSIDENSVYFDNKMEECSSKGSARYTMKQAFTRVPSRNVSICGMECTKAFTATIIVPPIPGSETESENDKESGPEEREKSLMKIENEIRFFDVRKHPSAAQGGDVQRGKRRRCTMLNSSTDHSEKQSRRKEPFHCETCGKYFSRNNHLEDHRRVHTGEKPFACTLCKKTFSKKGNVLIHMRVHSSERPFSCNICNKTFKRRQDLDKHMSLHSGKKPFKCQECGKGFAQIGQLNVHKRTHSGEQPFSCVTCGKRFTESGSLSRHRRRKHGLPSSLSPS